MAKTIQEISADRIGFEWREEDHAAVCHALTEIERTAMDMVRAAMLEFTSVKETT